MPTTWILLRGLVREQAHWNGFADRLAGALGADHRVMCMDLPGNGVRHRDRSPTRIAAMVDAAREDLAGRGVDGPIHLVALSLGGMVAMDWLQRHPRQVAAAALINSSAAPVSPFWHRLKPANYGAILRHGLLGRDRLKRERMILEITTNRLSDADKDRIARQFQRIDEARPVSAANTSFIEQTLGVTPSISTFMLSEKRTSRSELRNSMFKRTSGSTFLDFGSRIRRMSSADSSRTSARIGIFLVWISSAIRSTSFDF